MHFTRPFRKGPKPTCSSMDGKHELREGQLCLKIDFQRIFKHVKKECFLITDESRFFCLDKKCIMQPKGNVYNGNTNYKVPILSDISTTDISDNDRESLRQAFG